MSRPSPEARIMDLGARLSHNLSKTTLSKTLKETVGCLSELNQSPSLSHLLKKVNETLIDTPFLHSKDKDVRLLVSACFSEVMRILAPDPPYSDDVLKDIFKMFVNTFKELDETESSYFARRVSILDTVAKVRCCILMLDIGCDELILEMFQVFFSVVREDHPSNVLQDMSTIMEMIIEESADISQSLLDIILGNLLKENKNGASAVHKLAISVIQHCAEKLEPFIQRFFTSVMVERSSAGSDLHENYHNIIFAIYQCAPQMLLAVIPNLAQELLTDQVDVRLKAVHLLKRLFALPGEQVAHEYQHLFSEFLKRLSDKAVEVRLASVECARDCFLANPYGSEAAEILSGLKDRLLDFDEKVRVLAVNVICDMARANLKSVPVEIVKDVAERLRDKKVSVRKDALQKLLELYRAYCMKCSEGLIEPNEQFESIPSKILRVFYDRDCKEFRLSGMEVVLAEDLFPCQLLVEERAQHWIFMYSTFCPADKTALEFTLSQKQRLQKDMQLYLSLRQGLKEEDSEELTVKIEKVLKSMSTCFVDSSKAEENLQKFHQMKDNNVFKALRLLLDPDTPLESLLCIREDFLKRIGKRHPLYEFLKGLSLRCSYILFDKCLFKAVLKNILSCKTIFIQSLHNAAVSLLTKLVSFFPALVKGCEGELQVLLEKDDSLKYKAIEIIAKAGQFITVDCSVIERLKSLCQNGSRWEAKHAVFALASLSAESDHESLHALYKELLNYLQEFEKHPFQHLPSVLQSLGCIAQAAITVFEIREDDIIRFIVRKIFSRPCAGNEISKTSDEPPCPECQVKIYGLRTLVRSFLPFKVEHSRQRIKEFLAMLEKLLQNGAISDKVKSIAADREHIKLAAALSILKLARRWEQCISPELYHRLVLRAQESSVYLKKLLLHKVNKYLKAHRIGTKYASVFAIAAPDTDKGVQEIANKFLAEFVISCHREAQLRQTAGHAELERSTLTMYPAYVLVYLIHVLAHSPKFPTGNQTESEDAYEPFVRPLFIFLQLLLCQSTDGSTYKDDTDNLTMILSVLRAIKKSKDAVDEQATQNLYVLSDIGILLANRLRSTQVSCGQIPGGIPLPSSFYKLSECSEGEADDSSLPHFLRNSGSVDKMIKESSLPCHPQLSTHGKRPRRNQVGSIAEENTSELEMSFQQSKKSSLGINIDGFTCEEGHIKKKKSSNQEESFKSKSQKNPGIDGKKGTEQKLVKTSMYIDKNDSDERQHSMLINGEEQFLHVEEQDAIVNSSTGKSPIAKESSYFIEEPENEAQDNIIYSKGVSESSVYHARVCDNSGGKIANSLKNDYDNKERKKTTKTRREGKSNSLKSSKSLLSKGLKGREGGTSLVGQRIKVWWPVEKRFYSGVINGFNSATKTHKVSYDDGETELVHLPNERWEIIRSDKKARRKKNIK